MFPNLGAAPDGSSSDESDGETEVHTLQPFRWLDEYPPSHIDAHEEAFLRDLARACNATLRSIDIPTDLEPLPAFFLDALSQIPGNRFQNVYIKAVDPDEHVPFVDLTEAGTEWIDEVMLSLQVESKPPKAFGKVLPKGLPPLPAVSPMPQSRSGSVITPIVGPPPVLTTTPLRRDAYPWTPQTRTPTSTHPLPDLTNTRPRTIFTPPSQPQLRTLITPISNQRPAPPTALAACTPPSASRPTLRIPLNARMREKLRVVMGKDKVAFKCAACGSGFGTEDMLDRHVLYAHGTSAASERR